MSDSLLVRGGMDDTLVITGATQTTERRTIDGESYTIYTLGDEGAYLVVNDEINVVTT